MNPFKWLSSHRSLNWLFVVVYASIIFYFSSLSASGIPSVPVSNTWLHVLEYFGLGLVLMPAVRSSGRGGLFLAFILLAVYAASDEFHQYFVPGRVMDFYDWLADSAGGLLGLFLSGRSLD